VAQAKRPAGSAAREGDRVGPAARPVAHVDVDEGAARIAAETADQVAAIRKGNQPALVDAGNEDVRRHALHVEAVVLAADAGVVRRIAIAGADDHLAAEEGFEAEDGKAQFRNEAEGIDSAVGDIGAEVCAVAGIEVTRRRERTAGQRKGAEQRREEMSPQASPTPGASPGGDRKQLDARQSA
jgi:hypothetical protein